VIMTSVVAVPMVFAPSGRMEREASPQLMLSYCIDASLHRGMNCRNPAPTATWPNHYHPVMFAALVWRHRAQAAESLA
jgi:hypothetical protein